MTSFTKSGMFVDAFSRKIYPATVHVDNGKIREITKDEKAHSKDYILPGFIDAHVHVESSMLVPSEFARLASVHGTVAVVSDPHEIANVLGLKGIRYMIDNGKQVPFHFYFGAPSCVPATGFETSGATITPADIEDLFRTNGLKYLSEMMNYPGVLSKNPVVMDKIVVAKRFGRPIDGHAPGLKGEEAKKYIDAGISSDHECLTLKEALDKLSFGMRILIREGSAAKDFETLHSLIPRFPSRVMFCSDDKHPHELVEGHINDLVRRSVVEKGYDILDVLYVSSINPVMHYRLDTGLLRKGDSADFIVVNNLKEFKVIETYVKGELIAKNGKSLIKRIESVETPNHFAVSTKSSDDFKVPASGKEIHVIVAQDGCLATERLTVQSKLEDGLVIPDIENDILKISVVNRYVDGKKPAVAFIKNFGLKKGAIASSISHDSHNIIAVGCTDDEICRAINLLINCKGGISVVNGKKENVMALPVAGLMSNEDGYDIAEKYKDIDKRAKALGTNLQAPFMTLSFMSLLVIPKLKLSDQGLFDCESLNFIDLQAKK